MQSFERYLITLARSNVARQIRARFDQVWDETYHVVVWCGTGSRVATPLPDPEGDRMEAVSPQGASTWTSKARPLRPIGRY